MINVEEREEVRRAYYVEKKSQRRIASELQMARKTVRKAIAEAGPAAYTVRTPRPAPRLGAFKARIDELLAESERMPRKQRYTCLLYTSPSPRDRTRSRMPSSA